MSVVIQVDRLSKHYRLGQIGGKRLVDDVNRWWARLRGKEDPLSKVSSQLSVVSGQSSRGQSSRGQSSRGPSDALWALKDVSFEVKQGEVLGIIGRNGAGKSTLLKILSRVTAPTSGEVRVKGRIASLLEVGTGFHPELTGRENIFLNGAILGMTKAEIRSKFDEIVAFSEVEQFIDTPVKRYSSGMTVRLAFAVAAHLEPEILIVDEVLAVGDIEFQNKCLGKMKDVAGQGRTILFVSHNMQAIQSLCTRTILLKKGGLEYDGTADQAVTQYVKAGSSNADGVWRQSDAGAESIFFSEAKVAGFRSGVLVVDVSLQSRNPHKDSFIAIDITDSTGIPIMQALPESRPFILSSDRCQQLRVEVELPPLVPGRYLLDLWVGPHFTETFHYVRGALAFEQMDSPTPGRTFPHSRDHGFIVPKSRVTV